MSAGTSATGSRKGRRIALASAAGALLAAAATGFALREPAMERWWLWRMESEDEGVKMDALTALADRGSIRGARQLIRLQEWPSNANVWTFLDSHRRAVPAIAAILKDASEDARIQAANILTNVAAPDWEALVPALVEALEDDSTEVRGCAAEALGKIGPAAGAAVPALIAALKRAVAEENETDEWIFHSWFAEALGEIGAASVSSVLERLRSEDERSRRPLMQVFASMRRDATPTLVAYLRDPDDWTRYTAAEALGLMDADPVATPALIDALSDTSPFVIRSCMRALVRLEAKDAAAAQAFMKGLGSEDWRVRTAAVKGLGEAGDAARSALPLFAQLAFDESAAVRMSAVRALVKTGGASEEIIEVLEKVLLTEDNRRTRQEALKHLVPLGVRAVPAFVRALKSPDLDRRRQAAVALGQVGAAAAGAVPALVELLRDEADENLRFQALYVLGGLGPEAKEAAPVLREMLRAATSPAARLRVESALRRIAPEEEEPHG